MSDDNKKFSKRHWLGLLFLMIVLAIFTISQQMKEDSEDVASPTMPDIYPEFAAMYEADGTLGAMYQGTISGFFNGEIVQNMPVRYVLANGHAVYQGDILINPNRPAQASMGVLNVERYIWPDGLVAYEIHPNLPDEFRIHDAIAHWEEQTSIRFVERTESNSGQYRNYILFRPGNGCSSYVGMQGGMQPINLARACSTGNTIHEIGHALGLWHEQSRIDRDEYVDVVYANIISLYAFNFDKQTRNGQDLGEYDYGSIMHYPRWAFSKNGKDTIVPHDENAEIGQRDGLSAGDIDGIVDLYGD